MLAALKNPWIIGGGVLIGVLVLASRSGGGSAPAAPSMFAMGDAGAANLIAVNAQTSAAIAMEQSRTRAVVTSQMFKTLENLFSAQQQTAEEAFESQNGVFTTQIRSQTAVALDRQQNAARLAMAGVIDGGQTTRRLAELSAQRDIATIGARAAILQTGISAGVETHRVDVASRTAERIAQTQAMAAVMTAQSRDNAAVQVAAMNNQTAQKASQNNLYASLAGSAAGVVNNAVRAFA